DESLQDVSSTVNDDSLHTVASAVSDESLQDVSSTVSDDSLYTVASAVSTESLYTVASTVNDDSLHTVASTVSDESLQDVTSSVSDDSLHTVASAVSTESLQDVSSTVNDDSLHTVASAVSTESLYTVSSTVSDDSLHTVASAVSDEPLHTVDSTVSDDSLHTVTSAVSDKPLQTVASAVSTESLHTVASAVNDESLQDVSSTVSDESLQDVSSTVSDDSLHTVASAVSDESLHTVASAVSTESLYTVASTVSDESLHDLTSVNNINCKNNKDNITSNMIIRNFMENISEDTFNLFVKLGITFKDVYNTYLKLIQINNSQEAAEIKQLLLDAIPYTYNNGQLLSEPLPNTLINKFDDIEFKLIKANPKLLELLDLPDISKEIDLDSLEVSNFTDISNHWAEDSIIEANKNGFIEGITSTLFAPGRPVYVSNVFTFLDRVLLSNNVIRKDLSREIVEKYVPNKTDSSFYHIASTASKLSENTLKQVMNGTECNITREILAQILFEITDAQLPRIKASGNFIDIFASPYKDAIDYCVETGLLFGVSQNEMAPNKVLTRAELATVLVRLNEKLL
ncbi:hypothetical protein AN640_08775, partial [Candidatus Epulonipiscium fishelsonii]